MTHKKTANIKIIVLQSWHILTRTRTVAMFYFKCKIVRPCDFGLGLYAKGLRPSAPAVGNLSTPKGRLA